MTGRLAVEVIPYALPFRKTYRAAPGSIRRRELVLLTVRDENGLLGLGEAVPLSLRGGSSLEAVVAALDAWAVQGSEGAPLPTRAPARCAVVTALADLEAKRGGLPLWKALGEASAPVPVRCNATIGGGLPGEVAERAAELAGQGFSRIKIKVGLPYDDETVEAVRGAVGDEVLVRLDANGAWNPGEAISFLERVGPEGIEVLEQPTPDLPGLAEVRASAEVAIVADESVTSPKERFHSSNRCDRC